MSTSLLHLADLHLDRAFAGMGCQGELAIRRRLGLREALKRAGRTAQERGCVAITIGGDLYEHDRAGADTATFLVDTFASWAPIQVLLAPGNHDWYSPRSPYALVEWSPNVHLFTEDRLTPVELADAPSDMMVCADREKVQQVILNLLTNAIKFTPRGGRIWVEAAPCFDNSRMACIRVRDSGIGIANEKLESIFEPFVQLGVGAERVKEGLGLGLAISRDLARGMGGDLTAESAVGEGTTFTLKLPLA